MDSIVMVSFWAHTFFFCQLACAACNDFSKLTGDLIHGETIIKFDLLANVIKKQILKLNNVEN